MGVCNMKDRQEKSQVTIGVLSLCNRGSTREEGSLRQGREVEAR